MNALNRRIAQIGIAVVVLLVVALNAVYVVGQTQQGLVLRFGEPIRVVNAGTANTPGLHLKTPFLDKVILFDKRIVSQEADQEEIITADQQRLVVDAYIRYRINDPLQFYRTMRNEEGARARLDTLLNSSLRQILGSASQTDIVSRRRGALMLAARNDIAMRAQQGRYGISVLDLRIKRADLPTANRDAVFNRMRTQRQQEAAQIRAEGDRRKREIIATARQNAGQIQGEGDAQRASIFNGSFGRDPEFAAFYLSMQAYERGLGQGDTTMVLSPDSAFFRYFRNGPSGRR